MPIHYDYGACIPSDQERQRSQQQDVPERDREIDKCYPGTTSLRGGRTYRCPSSSHVTHHARRQGSRRDVLNSASPFTGARQLWALAQEHALVERPRWESSQQPLFTSQTRSPTKSLSAAVPDVWINARPCSPRTPRTQCARSSLRARQTAIASGGLGLTSQRPLGGERVRTAAVQCLRS